MGKPKSNNNDNNNNNNNLPTFGDNQLRRIWYHGEWYYSIIDVVSVLTESPQPSSYWGKLKKRVRSEGFSDITRQIVSLKLPSPDGKLRETETANRQNLLRIIQSIPSPNAEPFKQWLAQVGEERIEEAENPELALERMKATYRAKGYSEAWIEQRIKTDLIRNDLTDQWKERGARHGGEYAVLTNEIHKGTFELSVQAHKEYKQLPSKANLRDHMDVLEMALTSVGEATAAVFHQERDSQGFEALKKDAQDAGGAAGAARRALEERIGRSVVNSKNYLPNPAPNPQLSMFSGETEAEAADTNKPKGKNKR